MNILKILTDKRIKGNLGERAAAKFLKKKRYKILALNFVGNGHEIDIVARDKKNDTVAFVEVKTRSEGSVGYIESRPASAVTPEKQRSIIKASKEFTKRMQKNTRIRYDVIEVYLERVGSRHRVKEINHLVSAFDYNTAYDSKYFYSKRKDFNR